MSCKVDREREREIINKFYGEIFFDNFFLAISIVNIFWIDGGEVVIIGREFYGEIARPEARKGGGLLNL